MDEQVIKINEEILQKMKNNCGNDTVIAELLRKLIIEESFHAKSWHWKEDYEKMILKYLGEWENSEN